jgi:hypothetical protein
MQWVTTYLMIFLIPFSSQLGAVLMLLTVQSLHKRYAIFESRDEHATTFAEA